MDDFQVAQFKMSIVNEAARLTLMQMQIGKLTSMDMQHEQFTKWMNEIGSFVLGKEE